jgi:hypothetical protein
MGNEDDREMRQASKDNDRYAGNQKTPGSLHSKEANTRMNTGASGAKRGDDAVDLDGYDGRVVGVAVSKEQGLMEVFEPDDDEDDDEDDDPARLAGNDVDDIADDLLELDDEDTARAIARVIVRTGDVVGDLAASLEDDHARMNDRMETAD